MDDTDAQSTSFSQHADSVAPSYAASVTAVDGETAVSDKRHRFARRPNSRAGASVVSGRATPDADERDTPDVGLISGTDSLAATPSAIGSARAAHGSVSVSVDGVRAEADEEAGVGVGASVGAGTGASGGLSATHGAIEEKTDAAAAAATNTDDEEPTDFWDDVEKSFEAMDKFDFDLSGFNKKKDEVPFQKTRDKLYFTLGVINVCTIAYSAGGHAGFLPYFYTVKFPLLIGIRYFFYRGRKWHLFLLDFCYFANLLLLAYLWFFNDSPEVFMMIFGITTGPLAWAVLAFRNSLVFHSLDKITSAFIHITPLCLTFLLRHKTSDMWTPHYVDCSVDSCPNKFFWLTIAPTLFFIAHQLVYWIMLKCILCVPDDPCYLTSFRYLTQDKRSIFHKLVHLLGGKAQEFLFSLFYSLFAFVTMLPAYLWFEYEWVNFAFVCFVIALAVWNGANFYVEVFSRGYGGRASIKRRTAPRKPKKHVRGMSFIAR